MKFKIIVLFLFAFLSTNTFAQKKPYFTTGFDMIFSYGMAKDEAGNDVTSNLRFSSWYHFEKILNIDFSKKAGFIIGYGMQNVGMITTPKKGITVKQRAYSAGIPVGFRFGNLENGQFVTIGGTGEVMLDYKEKVFEGNKNAQKHHEWLSNNTTLFNPSVFFRYQKKSIYIGAKYYLLDFLNPSDIHLDEDNGTSSIISSFPKTSKLFYISLGYMGKGKSKTKKVVAPAVSKKVNLIFNL